MIPVIKPTTQNYRMNMRMIIKLGSPCVKNTDVAYLCAKMFGIFGKLGQSLISCMVECIIKKLLIGVDQRIQKPRHSKYSMEVRRIQYIFTSKVYPLINFHCLAHGAVPVLAGVVMYKL